LILDAQNIEKSSIYIYIAAAAAGIFSNYLRERRRRLSRSAYTSTGDFLASFHWNPLVSGGRNHRLGRLHVLFPTITTAALYLTSIKSYSENTYPSFF
jgi:uncharacterized membrane protein